MHAHPRAVRAGDPALWEKMRAGVAALVWARHGRGRCGVLHDKAHPCLAARQRPAGWHEGPDSTQAPHSSPNIVTPGPLLAAASESLLVGLALACDTEPVANAHGSWAEREPRVSALYARHAPGRVLCVASLPVQSVCPRVRDLRWRCCCGLMHACDSCCFPLGVPDEMRARSTLHRLDRAPVCVDACVTYPSTNNVWALPLPSADLEEASRGVAKGVAGQPASESLVRDVASQSSGAVAGLLALLSSSATAARAR
ncbi:hypothetical protein Q7P35_003250 [Cladosporium inversicolor]